MNYSIIFYIIGWILNLEAAFMLLPCITAVIYGEKSGFAFLITMAVCVAIGIPLTLKKPPKRAFYTKEGFVAVALSWIVLSIMGSVPFLLSGSISHPIDALFETVSGFTTTGASVISDVEFSPTVYSYGEVLLTGSAVWVSLYLYWHFSLLQADTI